MNQCLTHGQGWNFLTFAPIDGTKNKRHLLFQRAYNGSYIVGSGQCKGLNDLKPKSRAVITRPRRPSRTPSSPSQTDVDITSPPPMTMSTPEHKRQDLMITKFPWSIDTTFEQLWERARTTKYPSTLLDKAEARLLALMPSTDGPVESSRTLDEIEVDLMKIFGSNRL